MFSSGRSNVSGAWRWSPSHSEHLGSECTDDMPVHHPLTRFSTEEPVPTPGTTHSEGAAALLELARGPSQSMAVDPSFRGRRPREPPSRALGAAAARAFCGTLGPPAPELWARLQATMARRTRDFHFFLRVHAREGLGARLGQWNREHISKVQCRVLGSPPSMLKKPLFLMKTVKLLNLATAPPCSNQNHAATTIPCPFTLPS